MKDLDLVTIGRVSVDLYGQQIGGRLEDMASFAKAVGGCPANIAIGAARLGLRSALISRVGDEAMGRFIREQLRREGVAIDGLTTDPARLTALVLLGVRDETQFPLIFYRADCADAALDETDIDEGLIARSRAVLVTGTHFARPNSAAAQKKAMRLARKYGARLIFDIDYRPNLWGLAGHGAGEARFVASADVTRHLAPILPECDLIVGTEEEWHIAGGTTDTIAALRSVRAGAPEALMVVKRGAAGCVAFPGAIPESIDGGITGRGFPVEVFNVLGAGDAFMAGFLSGWLMDEKLERCLARANACGAFAVSRLLCAPEYPSAIELQHFMQHGSGFRALRLDPVLNHLHHVTTRPALRGKLAILSIDHGAGDLEPVAHRLGANPARIPEFKVLAVRAAVGAKVLPADVQVGVFLDGALGREALFRAEDHGVWIARQVPHGTHFRLNEWPARHVAKLIANARADARVPMPQRLPELQRIFAHARDEGREVLIEALPPEGGTTAALIEALYSEGLRPDYWLIETQSGDWEAVERAIGRGDPDCRGAIVIARNPQSGPDLARAAQSPCVIGFVGGRSVFAPAFERWLAGTVDDGAAVAMMQSQFEAFAAAFGP